MSTLRKMNTFTLQDKSLNTFLRSNNNCYHLCTEFYGHFNEEMSSQIYMISCIFFPHKCLSFITNRYTILILSFHLHKHHSFKIVPTMITIFSVWKFAQHH
ncbi:hypothetical protein Lalb_Chr16g0389511 [Lupinus albus]|uniref:Uncharacterized protein n=1 Tax=Lupinus albus TaxID=3870 RepID=A0A6A4P7V4_LUPAL|nr:hypothetical protein Lalb_Chr16g0389511 [Lupinus albus]